MSEQQVQDLFQQEDGVYRLYDGEEDDVVEDDIINNE
jgi:hypothetical protein